MLDFNKMVRSGISMASPSGQTRVKLTNEMIKGVDAVSDTLENISVYDAKLMTERQGYYLANADYYKEFGIEVKGNHVNIGDCATRAIHQIVNLGVKSSVSYAMVAEAAILRKALNYDYRVKVAKHREDGKPRVRLSRKKQNEIQSEISTPKSMFIHETIELLEYFSEEEWDGNRIYLNRTYQERTEECTEVPKKDIWNNAYYWCGVLASIPYFIMHEEGHVFAVIEGNAMNSLENAPISIFVPKQFSEEAKRLVEEEYMNYTPIKNLAKAGIGVRYHVDGMYPEEGDLD